MTIAEVSKKYGLTADTLRYYERIGLVPPVTRNPNGIRNYSEQDCRWVNFAKCMRGAGLPIETLIEYLQLFKEGDATIDARKGLLIEQRELLAERIEEMKKSLDWLDQKIERYDVGIRAAEKLLEQGEREE